MNNYEYIMASLPVLSQEYRYSEGSGFGSLTGEIRSQLSGSDRDALDLLLRGFDGEALDTDFYAGALKHRHPFLREYFRFDLNLRNTKVRWLNRVLGRPTGSDLITGLAQDGEPADLEGYRFRPGEFAEQERVEAVLAGSDLIERERGLDSLYWDKADALGSFHYFDLDAVLAFVVKLHIVDRWLVLDEESGRTMFRRLVDEVRGTFNGVAFDGS